MAIVTLQECLDFMDVESKGSFTITAVNDVLKLTSDEGGPSNIDVADGTYEGDALATALQTAMNADDTLTETGTITFAVSYSSSTYKFTLDATAGHTIAYTHSGSDAGLTFGFSEDVSASQTITSDTAVPSDPSDIVETIHDSVEDWITAYCHREFTSTSYSSFYDGTGSTSLFVKHTPITALTRVAIGRMSAFRIKNTSSDVSHAYVSVSSDTMTLEIDGGTNDESNSLTLSDYANITALIAAINALGSGWTATLENSGYGDLETTEICERFGAACGYRANGGQQTAYFDVPADAIEDFTVNKNRGEIYYFCGFPEGDQNIYIKYTAGYSTMPDDLKLAALVWVKYLYDKRNQEGFGITEYNVGHLKVKYEKIMPSEVKRILDKYRRRIFY